MKPIRKTWFNRVKKIIRLFVKPTRFVTLGEEIEDGSIIVCNHSGAGAPLAWELYSDHQFRFWGTYEMNSGLRSVYRYLVHTYYVQKKKMEHSRGASLQSDCGTVCHDVLCRYESHFDLP